MERDVCIAVVVVMVCVPVCESVCAYMFACLPVLVIVGPSGAQEDSFL